MLRLHVVLSKLVNLEEISLAGNALTSVPAALWDCTKLRKLDLSNNLLKELPEEMNSLQQLQVRHRSHRSMEASRTECADWFLPCMWRSCRVQVQDSHHAGLLVRVLCSQAKHAHMCLNIFCCRPACKLLSLCALHKISSATGHLYGLMLA